MYVWVFKKKKKKMALMASYHSVTESMPRSTGRRIFRLKAEHVPLYFCLRQEGRELLWARKYDNVWWTAIEGTFVLEYVVNARKVDRIRLHMTQIRPYLNAALMLYLFPREVCCHEGFLKKQNVLFCRVFPVRKKSLLAILLQDHSPLSTRHSSRKLNDL